MKLKNIIKNTMIGAMLVSGVTYISNPVNAKAAKNESPSNFIIGDGSTNLTPEQKEKTKESDAEYAHDQLIQKYMSKIEKEKAPIKGATIRKYTNVDTSNYVKNNKVYEYYKISWTKTSKFTYIGIPVRTATSYDKAIYSKTGNHIDSRAKLTSKQKKIISTLNKSTSYSKKYRYIAIYRTDTATKATTLVVVPRSGKSAHYEIVKHHEFTYGNSDSLTVPNASNVKKHNANLKVGYDLNILTHKATLKEWQKALGGGYQSTKLFYGYSIIGDNIATKIGK